ncbi:MAG TPA: sugar phosphate isomerase/epimerase family protein [Candidatus Bathyarchaeia archaeon]|jgi:sugar phosphate isomerase/epimerase|nr:sugar phosphate isomerase/epimerase family protein [Candidatus Bathyarchaeia archaeon]
MAKPEIGVSMLYCLSEQFKKMVRKIPKTETTRIEIVDDGFHELNKQRVAMLREIGESYGLKYSVHAPFADINIAAQSKLLSNATLKRLRQSIVNANLLNCHIWVFHPGMKTGISMFYPGMDWARNLESVRLLLKFADNYGVEVAIENVISIFLMKNVEDFKKFYSEINENIGLVLDTGHANINGQVEDFLTEFSNKIVHVHAHDNLGEVDQHLGIGYGNINWENVARLLKRANYDRTIVVESVEHVEESVQKLKQFFT